MKKKIQKNLSFNPTKETLLAGITLLIMWICYYIDQNGFFTNNPLWEIGVWGIGIIVILNVCFPAWWIVKKKQEGFAGMGVTAKHIIPALFLSLLLGAWRFNDLIPYIHDKGLLPIIVFNFLSIWEVSFIYSWLFTRYEKAFGKIGATLLTAVSVGIYHLGSLSAANILYLVLCVLICSACFAITKNIFTVWPIYWVIGCSASVATSYGVERFSWEITFLMGIAMFFQVGYLLFLKMQKTN